MIVPKLVGDLPEFGVIVKDGLDADACGIGIAIIIEGRKPLLGGLGIFAVGLTLAERGQRIFGGIYIAAQGLGLN